MNISPMIMSNDNSMQKQLDFAGPYSCKLFSALFEWDGVHI